jgi:hypothetical protein
MAKLTPIKAIRAKCLDCCGGQKAEGKLCPCEDCSLYPYRMGRRPKAEELDPFSIDDIEDISLEDFELPPLDLEDLSLDLD